MQLAIRARIAQRLNDLTATVDRDVLSSVQERAVHKARAVQLVRRYGTVTALPPSGHQVTLTVPGFDNLAVVNRGGAYVVRAW